jgi:hypothetical protein
LQTLASGIFGSAQCNTHRHSSLSNADSFKTVTLHPSLDLRLHSVPTSSNVRPKNTHAVLPGHSLQKNELLRTPSFNE